MAAPSDSVDEARMEVIEEPEDPMAQLAAEMGDLTVKKPKKDVNEYVEAWMNQAEAEKKKEKIPTVERKKKEKKKKNKIHKKAEKEPRMAHQV